MMKNAVIQSILYHDKVEEIYERRIYNFFDLLGDLGGVSEIIILVFGIFLLPISRHSFTIKATKKLFLARTKLESLFGKIKKNHHSSDSNHKNKS